MLIGYGAFVVGSGRGTVFGQAAGEYDDLRPGYPDELVDAVRAYAGSPRRAVEVGAGTGKATVAFASRGVPICCVEPDARMAAVLRTRVADHRRVEVQVGRFEDWQPPPGGFDLVFCAQAWLWVDGGVRCQRAHATLAPGGAVAVFGHSFDVVDSDVKTAVWQVHARLQPQSSVLARPGPVVAERMWFAVELAECGLFTEVRAELFRRVVSYSTPQYLALVRTFSAYRSLPPPRRQQMQEAIAAIVDYHGGVIDVDLATVLARGRRRHT